MRVFDEAAGRMRNIELPLPILSQYLPLECRYVDDSPLPFRAGAAAGAAIALCIGVAALELLGALTFIKLPLVGELFLSTPLSLAGILYGRRRLYTWFSFPPTWIIRRVYPRVWQSDLETRETYETIRYDLDLIVLPEYHTFGTGLPREVAQVARRQAAMATLAEAARKVQQRERVFGGRGSGRQTGESVAVNGHGNGRENGMGDRRGAGRGNGVDRPVPASMPGLAAGHSPRVHTAGMLYHILKCADVKEQLKGPSGTGKKLQQIAMGGMALGAVGMLVFVILISQN